MSEWYKDWFESGDYLSIYKHRDDAEAKTLLELLIEKLNLKSGCSILDIACGAGRHSIVFANKGFNVTAFDISRNLLKLAKERASSSGNKINLYCADIRNFAVKGKFDVILNLFTSFGYFEGDEENFQLFGNVYKYLNNSGYFIFDYFNERYLQNHLIPESIDLLDGKTIVQKRYLTENRRVNKDIIITDPVDKKYFKETVRLFSSDEIIKQIGITGFKIKEILGNYDGSEYNQDSSERLIIISQK